MQPKSLLRLPAATSQLEDLSAGRFQPVLDDPAAADRRERVRRLVFCTGKIYYDMLDARTRAGDEPGVALVRVEELAPWPHEAIAGIVDAYPNIEDVVWAQEEPRNMGAWTYVSPRLRASDGHRSCRCGTSDVRNAPAPPRVIHRRTRRSRRAS